MKRRKFTELESKEQLAILKDKLVGLNLPKGIEEDIVNTFWRAAMYDSLIARQRFLDYVVEYVFDFRPKKFNRFQFYDYLAVKLVPNNLDRDKVANLAFVMELMQVVSMPRDRFIELLGEDLTNSLEEEFVFILDEHNELKFVHFSIHSYFAAQKLKTLKQQKEFLSSLIYDGSEYLPFPNNWYDVLTYFFAGKRGPSVKSWLIETILANPQLVEEGLLNVLSFTLDDFVLNQQEKSLLFNFLLELYIEKSVWLPDSAEKILATLASEDELETLLRIVRTTDEPEGYFVVKGNAVGVIDEIIKTHSTLLGNKKEEVHDLLVSLANDTSENGVLQRRSARALQGFKRASDVEKIISMATHKDSMVREAYVIFAYTVAPNKKTTIEQLVKAMSTGSDIFARYGFYSISTEQGIKYFYSILGSKENSHSLQKFLSNESIFSDKGHYEDDKILNLTKEKISDSLVPLIKQFIWSAASSGDGYYAERSRFLGELIDIVRLYDDRLAVDFALRVSDEDRYYRVVPIIAKAAAERTLSEVVEILLGKTGQFDKQQIAYQLVRSGAEGLYEAAIQQGLIEAVSDNEPSVAIKHEESEAQRAFEEFIHALEPEPGRYMTNVFEKYNESAASINTLIDKKSLDKFKKLVKKLVLDASDPKDFTLKINNPESKNSTNYTISQVANYYGDAIKSGALLFGDEFILQNYRNKIVHFLPFAYNDDREYFISLLSPFQVEDMDYLSTVYSNRNVDTRYYLPDVYLDCVESILKSGSPQSIDSIIIVLKSFLRDPRIRIYYREKALEYLGELHSADDLNFRKYLQGLFKKYIASDDEHPLGIMANTLLITHYQNKLAAKWRFDEVISRAAPFVTPMGIHSVGDFEDELHDKKFGKPLTKLDKRYLQDFITLLDCSIDVLKKDSVKYMNYANYIWALSFDYFANLAKLKDDKPLRTLERWYAKNNKAAEGANWFEHKLEELRKVYSSELSKLDGFREALTKLREIENGGK